MKERHLFYLRLANSWSPRLEQATRKAPDPIERLSSSLGGRSSAAVTDGRLLCTCIHSSSPSCVAVGFTKGVVHVYRRTECDGASGRQDREEEKWKRAVLYPTRALSGSPNAASTVPDITCVSLSPGGDMVAVGTSDGFVFVTQVSGRGLMRRGYSRLTAACRLCPAD